MRRLRTAYPGIELDLDGGRPTLPVELEHAGDIYGLIDAFASQGCLHRSRQSRDRQLRAPLSSARQHQEVTRRDRLCHRLTSWRILLARTVGTVAANLLMIGVMLLLA